MFDYGYSTSSTSGSLPHQACTHVQTHTQNQPKNENQNKKPVIQNLKRPKWNKNLLYKNKAWIPGQAPGPEITGQYKTCHKLKELIESGRIKLKK